MPIQTAYSTTHNALIAGMVQTFQPHNFVSKLNNTVAVLPYGKGLVRNTEIGVQLPQGTETTALEFVGVGKYEINRAQADGDVAGGTVEQEMSVCTFGQVAVYARSTVAAGDPVYLRIGATDTGDFSNVVGTGATLGLLIDGARFVTGGDAGDIVEIAFGIGG